MSEDQIHDHPYALKGANDCSDGDRSVEPEGEEDGNRKEDSPSMGQNKLKEVALRLHLREDAHVRNNVFSRIHYIPFLRRLDIGAPLLLEGRSSTFRRKD